jgi:hypothetical protein
MRVHTARMPDVPVVGIRAKRAGSVPDAEQRSLAGVELPPGRPAGDPDAPHFWVSSEPLDRVAEYAARLAAVFARTGLWPLIWAWNFDSPESDCGPPDLAYLGAFSDEEVLRAGWEDVNVSRALGPFPGIAASAADKLPVARIRNPFTDIQAVPDYPYDIPGGSWRLLLVPCERPADVLAALGWSYSRVPLAMTAAVMRSWEARFGAVPMVLDPGSFLLSIDTPVSGLENAKTLAAEIIAMTSTVVFDESYPSGWSELAQLLLGNDAALEHAVYTGLGQSHWAIAVTENMDGATEVLAQSRMGDDFGWFWAQWTS